MARLSFGFRRTGILNDSTARRKMEGNKRIGEDRFIRQ